MIRTYIYYEPIKKKGRKEGKKGVKKCKNERKDENSLPAMFPQGSAGKNLKTSLESLYRGVYGILYLLECSNVLFTVSKRQTGCIGLSTSLPSICDT